MIHLKKVVSGALMVSTSLVLTGLGFVNSAFAAQLKVASATLSNSTAAAASVSYVVKFNIASTSSIGSMRLRFATSATNATKPSNLSTAAVGTTPAVTLNGSADTNWTAQDGTTTAGTVLITGTSIGYTAGNTIAITLSSMTNNDLTSNCDGTSDSTDSCWIQIKTYITTDGSGSPTDQTAINYTVITPVSVSATVDPVLNFVITGVLSTNVLGNDTHTGGGNVTTSTPTALSFGDIVAGSGGATLAQQQLDVLTNANGGYVIYNNFTGSNLLVGTAVGANNIDPFTEGGATWGSPHLWVSPSGTANSVNSGELGMRTSDTNAGTSQFSGSALYGPPTLTANTNAVMSQTTPDNGARHVYVTSKLEVNAYQPADLYTGSELYTVVATY